MGMYASANRKKGFIAVVRWASLALIFGAVVLTVIELVTYSRIRNSFPPGMLIAGVPVGGLSQEQTAQRLTEAYGIPVELRYQNAVIQVKPSVLGFELDLASMMTAADLQRVNQPFWSAFWAYLWNQLPTPSGVPLTSHVQEDRLRTYLQDEIASRYDTPATEALPVPGSVNFAPGEPGSTLDVERAVILISDALKSSNNRVVNLSFNQINPSRPSYQNLKILLEQVIDISAFDGITEIYLVDLQSGQELSFAYQSGQELPAGIAFTAASTIKIPIMVSVFRRMSTPSRKDITDQMELMIERSENDPADHLMEQMLDPTLGPLVVTEDLRLMGMENSFLAGHFYPGAPLLQRFETPANSRVDVSTDPDVYNQTTPMEIGQVLEDIYYCAEQGGGSLPVIFPGEITQDECQLMITYLGLNKIGVLIQAGVPDGTLVAHKHGWITESDGMIHTIADAGIVYSPGGNFVLTIFMNHPIQLVWEPANLLMAQISQATYNFYNQTAP
jgi:beta-lactamase class A